MVETKFNIGFTVQDSDLAEFKTLQRTMENFVERMPIVLNIGLSKYNLVMVECYEEETDEGD